MRATALVLLLAAVAAAEEKPRPPQGPPGSVTLPLAEYDRLLDRAARPPKRPEQPPLASVLARAELKLTVGREVARGSWGLEGEVFRSGPAKLALVSGATVLDARLLGKPLPLAAEGDTQVAVVSGPGPFVIALEVGAPVVSEPGRASLLLAVPRAGSASGTIEVPGESADVRVEPGLVTRRSSAGGRTTVEVTLEPGSSARVAWTTREATPVQGERESRYLADVRTLVTVGEADMRGTTLVDLQVVQGEPQRFELHLPQGFDVTSVSSGSLDAEDGRPGMLTLAVRDAGRRRHQVLVGLERRDGAGPGKLEAPLVTVESVQREAGEVAVEGVGTLELTASESKNLRRLDVREVHPALRALARQPLLAAFRYQRRPGETPALGLEASRFPDAAVLAAAAERAVVTTLVTGEGRALTEVRLSVRNRAQPFLRVALPEGATLFSAEVAGERVKPAKGDDGTRVPLLRAGLRPSGVYEVSFVYLASGTPFAKKGEAQLALPRMDLPVSVLEWELFVPERYRAKKFGGNALPAERVEWSMAAPQSGLAGGVEGGVPGGVLGGVVGGIAEGGGMLVGRVTDESGAALPGAAVQVESPAIGRRVAVTSADGSFRFGGLPPGHATLKVSLSGFSAVKRDLVVQPSAPTAAELRLKVATVEETVTVTAETPLVDTKRMGTGTTFSQEELARSGGAAGRAAPPQAQANAPSANVYALQRRVAGVLPVRVDVPRAGTSLRFVRPLVLDEETTVSFQYKTR